MRNNTQELKTQRENYIIVIVMEKLLYTVPTAEQVLDEKLFEAYRGERGIYLQSNECIEGKLYWGSGRSIGELAICRGVNVRGDKQFVGLRNKNGVDYLWVESHIDDDPTFGTFTPLLELEDVPADLSSESETMWWILEKTIDLHQTRLEWLERANTTLKSAPSYGYLIERERQALVDLRHIKAVGFSADPAPTYRQIMQEKRIRFEKK